MPPPLQLTYHHHHHHAHTHSLSPLLKQTLPPIGRPTGAGYVSRFTHLYVWVAAFASALQCCLMAWIFLLVLAYVVWVTVGYGIRVGANTAIAYQTAPGGGVFTRPADGTCPSKCFDTAVFSFLKGTDTCICGLDDLRALRSSSDAVVYNVLRAFAGLVMMLVGGVAAMAALLVQLAHTLRERTLLTRLGRAVAQSGGGPIKTAYVSPQ